MSKKQSKKGISDDIYKELSNPSIRIIGNYLIGNTIGEGTYGKVKEGRHLLLNTKVAIKVLDKTYAPAVVREIEIWQNLQHENIVKLYEVLTSETKIYLIMEYSRNGEIFDYLMAQTRLTEAEGKRIFYQLADAIDYCHRKGVVHRDLKLENILLDANMNVKLIDFGFTTTYDDNSFLYTFCGSPAYAAPEMIKKTKYIGPEVDVWSLGIILYTLMVGYLPFDDDNEPEMLKKITSGEYTFPDNVLLSSNLKSLIDGLLQVERENRMSTQSILRHPWLSEVANLEGQKLPSAELNSDVLTKMAEFFHVDKRDLEIQILLKPNQGYFPIYHLIKDDDGRTKLLESSPIRESFEASPSDLISPFIIKPFTQSEPNSPRKEVAFFQNKIIPSQEHFSGFGFAKKAQTRTKDRQKQGVSQNMLVKNKGRKEEQNKQATISEEAEMESDFQSVTSIEELEVERKIDVESNDASLSEGELKEDSDGSTDFSDPVSIGESKLKNRKAKDLRISTLKQNILENMQQEGSSESNNEIFSSSNVPFLMRGVCFTSLMDISSLANEFISFCRTHGIRYKKYGPNFFCQTKLYTKNDAKGIKKSLIERPEVTRRKSDSCLELPDRNFSMAMALERTERSENVLLKDKPYKAVQPISIAVRGSRELKKNIQTKARKDPSSMPNASSNTSSSNGHLERIRAEHVRLEVEMGIAGEKTAVKFKRISGEQWHYKGICDHIIVALKLERE